MPSWWISVRLRDKRGRHGAADIGVVDVAADEADELAIAEYRLPDMDVGRVGRDEARIGIVVRQMSPSW